MRASLVLQFIGSAAPGQRYDSHPDIAKMLRLSSEGVRSCAAECFLHGNSVASLPPSTPLLELSRQLVRLWEKGPGVAQISPVQEHTATCIFLHDMADTSAGWREIFVPISKVLPHVKFVFPTALTGEVLVACLRIPAWYDCATLHEVNTEYAGQIQHSVAFLHSLIDIERENLSGVNRTKRIVVGGLGQGGVVALAAALTCERVLSGVMAINAHATMQPVVQKEATQANYETPLLLARGACNRFFTSDHLDLTQIFLKTVKSEASCIVKVYEDMDHKCTYNAVKDMGRFLIQCIG